MQSLEELAVQGREDLTLELGALLVMGQNSIANICELLCFPFVSNNMNIFLLGPLNIKLF